MHYIHVCIHVCMYRTTLQHIFQVLQACAGRKEMLHAYVHAHIHVQKRDEISMLTLIDTCRGHNVENKPLAHITHVTYIHTFYMHPHILHAYTHCICLHWHILHTYTDTFHIHTLILFPISSCRWHHVQNMCIHMYTQRWCESVPGFEKPLLSQVFPCVYEMRGVNVFFPPHTSTASHNFPLVSKLFACVWEMNARCEILSRLQEPHLPAVLPSVWEIRDVKVPFFCMVLQQPPLFNIFLVYDKWGVWKPFNASAASFASTFASCIRDEMCVSLCRLQKPCLLFFFCYGQMHWFNCKMLKDMCLHGSTAFHDP